MPVPYTNPLATNAPAVPTVNVSQSIQSRLGSGFTAPLTMISPNTWATVSGVAKVQQDILVCISTLPGRRMVQCDYGCLVPMYMFEPWNSITQVQIQAAAMSALTAWVPQIVVSSVVASLDPLGNNLVNLAIKYTIKGILLTQTVTIVLDAGNGTIVFGPGTFAIGNYQPFTLS